MTAPGLTNPPPARPYRPVTSFVRRSARMNPSQRRAWETHQERWLLDVPRGPTSTSVAPGATVDLAEAFGRPAPLVVEIGCGAGDVLVPLAAARPEQNFLGFEVFHPAIASLLARLVREQVAHVRVAQVDAVDGFHHLLTSASVAEVWTFFPDPWPKTRHHKRRLLSHGFADLVTDRLVPGGRWRLATDWADYAESMRELLDGYPALANEHPPSWAPRWPDRPVTRFEQRGLDAGRRVYDLCYRRRPEREVVTGA